MSSPDLSISVEPVAGSKATYLPLVAPTSNETPKGKIVLRLIITNNGPGPVTITGIVYAFPGSSVAPVAMQGVNPFFSGYYKNDGGAILSPGQSKTWTNGLIYMVPDDKNSLVNNAVFLPEPIPSSIQAQVTCAGFSAPATVTLPLVPHRSPTPQGSYFFPYRASDLRIAEYYVGSAVHWANGGADGTQIFAHDFGCEGYDVATRTWSRLLPGKSGTANPDYRLYGKPIRALADGTVAAWHDGLDENTVLGQFPSPTPSPLSGNSMTITFGDENVIFCHLQKGSIPAALKVKGAPVKAGQVIGLVGNTGNSTEPHTHIEAESNVSSYPLRPLPFHDAYALAESAFNPPDPQGPWSKLSGRGLPKEPVAVWPASTPPAWYPPGWGEIARSGISNVAFQMEFNKATTSGYRMVWVDGFDVGGQPFFNMIFRPNDGTTWQAEVGLDPTHFQIEFDKWKATGYRPLHVETFLSGGTVLYAGIWVKTGGPAWSAYHGKSAADHKSQFNTLTKQGFVPTVVSAVETSGGLLYTALYEKRDEGGFVLSGALSLHDYQTQTDTNIAAGLHPASLNAISNGGNPLILGLWEQKASANFVVRHGQNGVQYQAEYDRRLQQGFLTRALSGCDDGHGNPLYSAIWSK